MTNMRIFKYVLIALAASALGAGSAGAQPYPARDITFIVAFAPGGVADTLARLVGKGLGEKLGRTVVVENRGGAGGNIAAASVARAAPDGYTLLVTTTAVAINETLRPNKGFAASDLKTIAIVASSPEAFVTGPANPAANLADFLKNAKGKSVTFASAGVGSGSHIAAEYFFKEIAKVNAVHVPFQGGAPAIAATIGNQVDLMATTLGGGAAAQIAHGKLKGLGVASAKRAAVTPNVPTYGRPATRFDASSWVGVFAPAGTNSGDHRQTQRDDRTGDEGPGAPAETHRDRVRSDRRVAGACRYLLQGRSRKMGQNGQDIGAFNQIDRNANHRLSI